MGFDVCAQMRNRARSSGQRHVFIVKFWPQLTFRDSRCPREAVDISRVGHPFGGPRPYEGSDRYTLRIAAPVILCVPSRTRVPVSTPNPSHDSSEFSDLEDTPLGPRAFPSALSVSRSSPFRIDFLEKVFSASHAVLDRRFAWACSSGSGTVLNYRASKIIADSDSMIRRRARDNGEGRCAEARRAIAALSAQSLHGSDCPRALPAH